MKAIPNSYTIIYNSKNITSTIQQHVISFSYTDNAKEKADEIELLLEDMNRLWQNEWYPKKGDTIQATIETPEGSLNCGTFTVDEITGSGGRDAGNTFAIKAIAATITKKLRTKTCYAHENKTLREIVNTVAQKHGLSVAGSIADVTIERFTQYNETDLKALSRLAADYGYTFSVRGTQLVFTNIYEIESREAALTISCNEVIGWSITDKTAKTYTSAKVSHHKPKKKALFTFEVKETGESASGVKVDTLHLKVKAENKQQAELKAKAALYNANTLQQEGSIEMPGNIYAIAGNGCEFVGAGLFSGRYYINSSTHNVSKDGGYTTSLEIKRIGLVQTDKQKL